MINFDEYTNENKRKHNPNWPYISDHPYRILIIGGSGSGKTNALLNLINNQPDIEKIYLYAKDPHENKYQFLIKKRESTGIELQQIAISHSSDLSAGDAIPNRAFTIDEAREELNKIKEIEKNVDRERLFYKSNKDTNHFKGFRAIRTFREDIYEGKTTFDEADEYQSDLADRINDFIKKTNPHTEEKKREKKSTKKNLIIIIIQCNNSESLLNEIRQIIYSLYQSKDITEKVYNNLLTSL